MSFTANSLYKFEVFELDPARRLLSRDGTPISVSPKAFDVLRYLVANSGRVVTKEELLRTVWPDSFVEEGNLQQYISGLRKALTDRANLIATVPGQGYQFTANVQVEAPASAALDTTLPTQKLQTMRESTHVLITETSTIGTSTAQTPALPALPRRLLPRWPIWIAVAVAILAMYFVLRWKNTSQLRVSNYAQITYDGHAKFIGGTDGSRIYFTQEQPNSIAQVSVSGGAVEPITVSLQDPWAGDVSPDGSTLLLISNSGGHGPEDSLWSLQVLGGSLRRLANAVTATWSPDGQSIAYATANGDICLMRHDGADAHRIASPGGYIKSIAWSPSGNILRFSKEGILWEMTSTGSNLHQFLPGWGISPTQWNGQWDRDGRFYFVANGQIWTLDERHGFGRNLSAAPLQLTFGPTVWDQPVVSLDGKKIFASGRTNRGELVRFDPYSGQSQPFLGGISAEFVSFSRDGKSLAYVTYPEGVLWRANPDGSNPVQLTEPPVYPKSLCWSPDGKQILFVDRTAQGTDAIYILPAEAGAKPRRLLPYDREAETDPSWSPDGRRIAFSTSRNVGATSKSDLRILDLSTGNVSGIPASDGLLVPHWSPDGRSISAMTLDTMSMRVFSVLSGQWSKLDSGPVAFPDWSRDSRYIYYVKWTDDRALMRIRAADGKREIIAELKGARYTGFYSLWMQLDPADTPLLLHDAGSDDIYALTLERND
jgi:DNA-binding winged helix-turn-helix (wHTH) protein/Tol biopolymer transport system component